MPETPRPQVLAALTAITISSFIAGCSSAPAHTTANNPNPSATSMSAHDKAVKFTECMRQSGVRDFPDPNASGEFPDYGVSVTPAQWKSALSDCRQYQPPGSFSAKMTPKQLSTALKFAQCMRAHGVPDFPDPVNGQPLIDTTKIPSSNRPGGMAILNAAGHKCGDLIRAVMAGH